MPQICQLTSSHPRYDTRIFRKECQSLANAGFDTILIVADGKGNETIKKVNIIDVGKEKSRRNQLLYTPQKIYKKALQIEADIYHFHDPELIFIANKLRKKGKKIIYDVHEDVPRALLTRTWLPKPFMQIISFVFEPIENFLAKKYFAIITATPYISKRFLKINTNTHTINNFPIINELKTINIEKNKQYEICYLGGIEKIRGILPILDALLLVDNIKLNLAGNFENKELENELKKHKAWNKVNYYGFVSREEASRILAKSKIGFVTFLHAPNHIHARPNKMFEYMSAGLPVIASDFEDWKQIVEKYQVGICVNPQKPKEIAKAITKLFGNEKILTEMAERGKNAVARTFNWEAEAQKLISIYREL